MIVRGTMLGLLLAVGVVGVTLFIGILGPLIALAVAVALIGGTLILLDTHWGFVALVGVVFVLPFGSLPFRIGFKPTFLDVALGALFFVWLFKVIIGQERELIASPLGALVLLFMLLAIFSFAYGMTHSAANSFFIRRFAEILLGIALFFAAVNTVRTCAEAIWVTRWVMLGGWACGTIAVLFYIFPDQAVWVLDRMARFDYPGGYSALRYVEDDPNGTMRAIGTAIDPNVLGGMMILVCGLVVPQLFTQERLWPRWLTILMLTTAILALFLTQSRSAQLGLVTSVGMLAVLKYRWLIPLGLVGIALFFVLPWTQEAIARLLAGFAGEDLATQMRFGEYKDALILISRYPFFGVGFTGVPDIDIYLGVSMLYLIIAENMGLVGLFVFLMVVTSFLIMVFRSWRKGYEAGLEAMLLGYSGAMLGALMSGFFDHYWFNMTYPHMTVLFWLYLGVATAIILVQQDRNLVPVIKTQKTVIYS